MIEVVTAISLWELTRHAVSWVANLRRAGEARKRESKAALRGVIVAARKTAVYVRQLQETGRGSHTVESELATVWTELSFQLEDLGLEKLAKRCRIKGREWADPGSMDPTFLEKSDSGLDRMERLAREVLKDIGD